MKLKKEDILKITKGLKSSDPKAQFEQMFTKDLKLKKSVGKAQKSWNLVSVKGCRGTAPEEKLNESKSAFICESCLANLLTIDSSLRDSHLILTKLQMLQVLLLIFCFLYVSL